MKLDELEHGTIYKCKLSGAKTLVIKQAGTMSTPSTEEGGEPTITETEVITGKVACVDELGNGDIKYFFNEIYDGQLEEIKD